MWSGLLDKRRFTFAAQARFLPAGKTGGTRVPPNAGSRTNARWFKSKLPNPNKKSTEKVLFYLVGTIGFEPTASCSQSKRSTRLS